MADRQAAADPRRSGLQRDDGHASLQRLQRGALEAGDVFQPLDMQADGADLRLFGKDIYEILQRQHRLVPGRDHVGKGYRALAHGQVGGQHPALGDDGRAVASAAAAIGAAMGEGPERHPVDIVQHAVAVRPNDRKIARRRDQSRLGFGPFWSAFAEAGGIADRAARPDALEGRHRLDGGLARDREEHRVGRLRQILDAGKARMPADLAPPGIDWPDRAGIADPRQFACHRRRIAPADQGDVAGLEQPEQVLAPKQGHAPSGLRIERVMMWRWISEVPSQIRSSRESRHRRCTGNSSISPMPPWICTVWSATRFSISEQ